MKLVASPSALMLALAGATTASAFMTKPTTPSQTVPSKTALSAVLPPMIISPIIKKMREENAKKNQPMVEADEASQEAPGLRVGKGVWKWPAFWPYDDRIFKSSAEANQLKKKQQMDAMTSMLSGQPALPTPGEAAEQKEAELKFDPLQYWSQEQANATTAMPDKEAQDKLKAHFSYYLPKNQELSILELGAAEDSYLPADDDLFVGRHVGVSASPQLMQQNPSLTETMVLDLNKVVPDRDIDNDDLRRLAADPFDVVLLTNTVEYLTNPREVFRSAWYLLKPGGTMFVAFRGKEASKNDFSDAQTAIWQQYNDDQHMWITGSFFQFSAGDGWESLLGFDISPESAKAPEGSNPLQGLINRGTGELMYVVQATKGYQDDSVDLDNLERSIGSLTWMLPSMEDRDKKLVVPRLVRCLEATSDPYTMKAAIERNIPNLPTIYEALVKMDQFAFTFSMQSQMAAELVCDPDFEANEAQMLSLRQGLGLRTPGEDFWMPVGQATAAMEIEDKISLLGYLVPRFGSNNPEQEAALQTFVTGLKPTYAVIRSKCPELEEADVELMGTDFLAVEVLKPGVTTRQEFAAWLASLQGDEIREMLTARKAIRRNAKEEVKDFKDAREERKKRVEELRLKMEEQMKKAREERSLIFNPRTEKMEVFDVNKR